MIELEKLGIPTVAVTARPFVSDAHRSAQTFGLPQLPLAVVAEPFSNRPAASICDLLDESIDDVKAGLTKGIVSGAEEHHTKEIVTIDEDWLAYGGDNLLDAVEAMNQQFLEYGWGDGFPLRPATEHQVERMLSGTAREPQDVVAVLEPGFGLATVEKIAANAVMAGCRPEHLPVVITAVECLAEPKMNLRNKAMSTGPHAPLVLVNGPITRRIGLNAGVCSLGPGASSFANTVIGRAVRLCMMNLGHTYAGVSDMDTIGSPLKYSLCIAENEEASPWVPYHVDRGYDAKASTVSVQFVYGICELMDFVNHDASRLIDVFSSAAINVAQFSTGLWLTGRRADPRYGTDEKEHNLMLICPDHARIFAQAGWTKSDIGRAMHKRARVPFHTLIQTREPRAMATFHPELDWLWDSPDTLLPVLEDADCYDIAVVGGTAGRGAFFWGAGGPVLKAIQE